MAKRDFTDKSGQKVAGTSRLSGSYESGDVAPKHGFWQCVRIGPYQGGKKARKRLTPDQLIYKLKSGVAALAEGSAAEEPLQLSSSAFSRYGSHGRR